MSYPIGVPVRTAEDLVLNNAIECAAGGRQVPPVVGQTVRTVDGLFANFRLEIGALQESSLYMRAAVIKANRAELMGKILVLSRVQNPPVFAKIVDEMARRTMAAQWMMNQSRSVIDTGYFLKAWLNDWSSELAFAQEFAQYTAHPASIVAIRDLFKAVEEMVPSSVPLQFSR